MVDWTFRALGSAPSLAEQIWLARTDQDEILADMVSAAMAWLLDDRDWA